MDINLKNLLVKEFNEQKAKLRKQILSKRFNGGAPFSNVPFFPSCGLFASAVWSKQQKKFIAITVNDETIEL